MISIQNKGKLWGDQNDGTYKNPVLWADYNNPDIIRVGSDFYMIASSHHYMGIPLLHSKDMINWQLINTVCGELKINQRYDQVGQAYQHGSWAPSIVFHKDMYYVYFCTPEEGLYLVTSRNPKEKWEDVFEVKSVAGWEDPYPFWDEDGKAYLLRCPLGAGSIWLHAMSVDGRSILDEGICIAKGPVLEGPKIFKKNGYYYIHGPEGGIDNGWQVFLRSKNIEGPYEKQKVLEQGSTHVNGPHQGSWIELENGQCWFYHFQQYSGYGRILHLQPARWNETTGWPEIGIDYDLNGVGEPVSQYTKPDVGDIFPVCVPQSSDEFSSTELGHQWRWNHNPVDSMWSLKERPGFLRLKAMLPENMGGISGTKKEVIYKKDSIIFAKNTLVQMLMGKESIGETRMDLSKMQDGQRAGLCMMGQNYCWIGIVKENNICKISANMSGVYTNGTMIDALFIYLRCCVLDSIAYLYYSLDGKEYKRLGNDVILTRDWYEGAKYGLFTYNVLEEKGYVDFDWFHYQHDGPF